MTNEIINAMDIATFDIFIDDIQNITSRIRKIAFSLAKSDEIEDVMKSKAMLAFVSLIDIAAMQCKHVCCIE